MSILGEKPPHDLEYEPVELLAASRQPSAGRAAIRRWSSREAFWRGFRLALRIAGVLLILPLPFAFLEPFLFMVWGGLLFTGTLLVAGPFFHLKYWDERESFFFVEGDCPRCKAPGPLKPYLSTAYENEFSVLCPNCGQTSIAKKVVAASSV